MKATKIFLTTQIGRNQRMTISSAVEGMENRVFSYTVGGAIITISFGGKNLAMFIKI